MKTLVLSSSENFVWHSMQEIIPYIESKWALVGQTSDVATLNVDECSLTEVVAQALKSQNIVLTCFNHKICKIASYLRFKMGLEINFIVYVHNMATIAFWPFREWGNCDFFKKSDLFVTSCQNDETTLNAIFNSPNILQLPFCYRENSVAFLNKSFLRPDALIYVGRISAQKNLHNLILGYAIASKKQVLPELHLFGKDDGLGSPNMAIQQQNHFEFLTRLTKDLNLTDKIKFHGHVDRSQINKFLAEKSCVGVSASLHSDENFGMAVFQQLLHGNRVLISDWGGHSDFAGYFPGRVDYITVQNSDFGPAVSADAVADGLLRALQPSETSNIILPEIFELRYQAQKCLHNVSPSYNSEVLNFSDLANRIFEQKKQFPHPTKIFSGYNDPLFIQVSNCYVGKSKHSFHQGNTPVPWALLQQNIFRIEDPHKGTIELTFAELPANAYSFAK